MLNPYRPEALTDFSQPANVAAFQAALDTVKARIGQTYPLVINGQSIALDKTFDTINPARPAEVLARFADGSPVLLMAPPITPIRPFRQQPRPSKPGSMCRSKTVPVTCCEQLPKCAAANMNSAR